MQTLKMAGTIGVFALLTAACSDSPASVLPTAPSAMSAPAAALTGALGAETSSASGNNGNGNGPVNGNSNGNGNGNGSGNGNGKDKTMPTTPSAPVPPTNTSPVAPVAPGNPVTGKTEIEGVIASKDGTSITVRSQMVLVPSTAIIRHGSRLYTFADLAVGDRVHVRANRVVSGTGVTATTQLEATEVRLQNPSGDDEDDEDGEDDEDDEDDEDQDDDEDDEDEVEVKGTLSSLSGSCPAVAFTVGTTNVRTSAATKFEGGACAAVRSGNRVEVKGTQQTDGTLLATVVEID